MALTARAPSARSASAAHTASPGRHDVVDTSQPVVTTSSTSTIQRPRSRASSRAWSRTRPRRWPPGGDGRGGTGRSSRGCASRAGSQGIGMRVGGRGGDQLGLVVAALAAPRGVDRDRDEDVAAGARASPACGDRLAERTREPALARVLEGVERPPERARERRAPLELEQRVRAGPRRARAASRRGARGAHRWLGGTSRRSAVPPRRSRDTPRGARDPAAGRRVPAGVWPWGRVWRPSLIRDSSRVSRRGARRSWPSIREVNAGAGAEPATWPHIRQVTAIER